MKTAAKVIFLLINSVAAIGQATPIDEDIAGATTYFTIEEEISESGYTIFDSIFRNHQFVILGEYHGSSRISELTYALIPIYERNGGKKFGLEIGPVANGIIRSGLQANDAEELLYDLNSKYGLKSDRRRYTPIPFFSNVLDAKFLQRAKEAQLETVGFDQEYIYSYVLLLDEIENELAKSGITYPKMEQLRDTVVRYQNFDMEFQNEDRDKRYRLPVLFQESVFVNEALMELSGLNEEVAEIVASIKKSNTIYYNNATGNWWKANELRTINFVDNFRSAYVEDNAISREKLFLKIGGLHAAKGMNNYYKYDIGNLIYETARLAGSQSCHIVVLDRFRSENNEVEDVLSDTTSWYAKNFTQFLEHSKPDEWAIIDLDRIRRQGLYKKEVGDRVREYFERYDYVILTPVDEAPKLNGRE